MRIDLLLKEISFYKTVSLHTESSSASVLYCTVLYCPVLSCTVLNFIGLYFTGLYFTGLYFTVLFCTVFTALNCKLFCTVMY